MIKLSFDDEGNELTTRRLLDGMEPVGDANNGVLSTEPNVSRIIDMVPFQTTVLLPPTVAFDDRDALLGRAWSQTAASVVPALVADLGPEAIGHMLSRDTDRAARRLRANVMAHPSCWPEARRGYGYSMQRRAAVQFWQLDRRRNAAVGLLEIATDAQRLSAAYSGADSPLKVSDHDLANAIQMVCCLWLEDTNIAAAGALEKEIRRGFQSQKTGETTIFEDATLDDVCHHSEFGKRLLRTARQLMGYRARQGEEGYSARFKMQFWFTATGDDLAVYADFQAKAVADHLAVQSGRIGFPLGNPASVVGPRHPPTLYQARSFPLSCVLGRRPTMTMNIEAAHCARDNAMMITAQGLDPMRAFLARPPAAAIDI